MNTSHSTTPFPIPVRHDLRFDFTATPAHHFVGNRLTSHFWNAISIVAPATETFLVRTMKRARETVTDAELRLQIDAFLVQEGLHTRHHRALNARLAELGYDVERASAIAERTIRELADESSVRLALALVIAGEFAIYAIAKTVLETPAALAGTSNEVRRLLQWHALEEMEHQSVACDVYRALYGHGTGHRFLHMRALLKACRVLVTAIRRIDSVLNEADGSVSWAEHVTHMRYLLLSPGVVRGVLGKLPHFFSPGFRPWADPRDLDLLARARSRI